MAVGTVWCRSLGSSTPQVRFTRRAALPESVGEEASCCRGEAEAAEAEEADATANSGAGRRWPLKRLAMGAAAAGMTIASLSGAGGSPALASGGGGGAAAVGAVGAMGAVAAVFTMMQRLALLLAVGRLVRPLGDSVRKHCKRAMAKFLAGWKGALMIPVIAAFVGWFTNWLAVKMIFYPVSFMGLDIHTYVGQVNEPLGWIGWQGIVPAKAAEMSFRLVEMVTSSLVDVSEVFGRLDPHTIAGLLKSEVPAMASSIGRDLLSALLPASLVDLPAWLVGVVGERLASVNGSVLAELDTLQVNFLAGFTQELQRNTDRVIDLKELVVKTFASDAAGKSALSELFQVCGRAELAFLTNSGLWFGYLLGVFQMILWMFWDNPWTLTIGGAVVGYLTNWIALKCIFEPVEPVQVGPFVLQGLFLKRQQEVSAEFSDFLTTRVLTSERLWDNMLHGDKSAEFRAVLSDYTHRFATTLSQDKLGLLLDGYNVDNLSALAEAVADKLPEHIAPLHGYIDATLNLQTDIRERMKLMTSAEFEQVLHPIFQQDEFTLIMSGAVLGAIAGGVQQVLTVMEVEQGSEADTDAAAVDEAGGEAVDERPETGVTGAQ